MANPTTNYGFVLPTSTDLVTDLPADFDIALQGVDTRLKALQPGTTLGDIAYSSATANTSTRLPIGTTGQVLAVSGGVPAWTTTADVTPLTTKGDLFTFDTADARLGVGTNGQTLVADSSTATGLKWATPATSASGLTFIQRSTFSGVANTGTTFDGIFSSTYSSYIVIIENFYAGTSTDDMLMKIRIGAADGPTTYSGCSIISNGANTTITAINTSTAGYVLADQSGTSTEPTRGQLDFPFMGATGAQMCSGQFSNANAGRFFNFNGTNYAANAYTGLQFLSSSSNITGTISVYGLAKS
jgi:hypothetical protein